MDKTYFVWNFIQKFYFLLNIRLFVPKIVINIRLNCMTHNARISKFEQFTQNCLCFIIFKMISKPHYFTEQLILYIFKNWLQEIMQSLMVSCSPKEETNLRNMVLNIKSYYTLRKTIEHERTSKVDRNVHGKILETIYFRILDDKIIVGETKEVSSF